MTLENEDTKLASNTPIVWNIKRETQLYEFNSSQQLIYENLISIYLFRLLNYVNERLLAERRIGRLSLYKSFVTVFSSPRGFFLVTKNIDRYVHDEFQKRFIEKAMEVQRLSIL